MPSILLDATSIPKQPVGAGIYIKNIVRGLLHSSSDFQFRVLAHQDDFSIFELDEPYQKQFIFQKDHGRGARILSEQFKYPSIINQGNFCLYHGLHYSFPIIKPCPLIVTIHDLTYFTHPEMHIYLKRFYFKFFIKQACKKVDNILAISNNTKTDLLNIVDCDPEKITVTSLGVDRIYFMEQSDIELEKTKQKYDLPENFILFMGLIEPRKNVPLLIRAYLNLIDHFHINQHLVIAGRWGWESKNILEEIDHHPQKSKIHFLGYVDENDKPSLYKLADIFVYPSAYEGFGLPVLEAMASGTPVISSNISSMPEIVRKNGILINPNDQSALENAIKNLLNDSGLQELFSTNGKKQAQDFSWDCTINQTLLAYEKVLQQKGKK
ncbi:MAG: glycosyltransferase family 4 protein [Anaerolineaceae bacterium]